MVIPLMVGATSGASSIARAGEAAGKLLDSSNAATSRKTKNLRILWGLPTPGKQKCRPGDGWSRFCQLRRWLGACARTGGLGFFLILALLGAQDQTDASLGDSRISTICIFRFPFGG
jgi:hypothetical protein